MSLSADDRLGILDLLFRADTEASRRDANAYADLFTEIPEHRFRLDISSSEIRARSGS